MLDRLEIGTAVFPRDVAVSFQFFEVLANSGLGYFEGGAEVSNASASFLLKPLKDLLPPRFRQQSR